MKNALKFFLVVLALGFVTLNSQASTADDKYYEISSPTVTDVTDQYPQVDVTTQPGLAEDCNSVGKKVYPRTSHDPADKDFNPTNEIEAIVDHVLNVGKKLWDVVLAGKPAVNVKLQTANALPEGLQCWVDLQGWKVPQTKVYRVTYKNGFGMDVVDYAFRVSFTAGGNAGGVGKYITNATMMTANLNVAWGFTFNATAEVPSVYNMGTVKNPVAAMQMVMKWSVDTPVKHIESSETFFMNGENQLIHLN